MFLDFCPLTLLQQWSANSFIRGPHKLIHNSFRGPDILRNVIVAGYVILPNQQFFVNILLFHF